MTKCLKKNIKQRKHVDPIYDHVIFIDGNQAELNWWVDPHIGIRTTKLTPKQFNDLFKSV